MATLITGGAGFVGIEVARMLLDQGEKDVAVFSRNPSPERLGDLAGRVTALAGDLGTYSHVLDAVKTTGPERIYHLGAMLSVPSDADPASAIQSNAMGTFHVLEAARLFEVRQVIFSSSVGTYGHDMPDGAIDDATIQRPHLFYGATKVFGEHMGLFYKRKYGLDFRGIRYPSVVGPGVSNPGVAQYTSWVIEECARGKPFTIWVAPETRIPIMYITEAAAATVQLAAAPLQQIRAVNYIVDGAKPTPSAGELAAAVKAKVPGARIDFEPNPEIQPLVADIVRPLDDSRAQEEWGWRPTHDLGRMIDEIVAAVQAS
ncbi:MAG: NAD-dependent epimerase/dehydratase family protein [Alphaproteobacteria bacterium]|jgi:threonine 3-dehydrogenase|nr:NAD-dependent epimerase/dehydratase family protein [Alphaproteobacteria bacterium]